MNAEDKKEKESYTHWSQVRLRNVRPGTFTPEAAGKIAEALGLEAFQYSADDEWYALDDDGRTTIQIDSGLALRLDAFRI